MVNVGWKYLAVASTSALTLLIGWGAWELNRPFMPTRTVFKSEIEPAAKPAAIADGVEGSRTTFTTEPMPMPGLVTPKAKWATWTIKGTVEGKNETVELRFLTDAFPDPWTRAAQYPIAIIGGEMRLDLHGTLSGDGGNWLLTCEAHTGHLSTIARYQSPRMVFGSRVVEFDSRDVATCRAVIRKMLTVKHRNLGWDDVRSEKVIRMNTGEPQK